MKYSAHATMMLASITTALLLAGCSSSAPTYEERLSYAKSLKGGESLDAVLKELGTPNGRATNKRQATTISYYGPGDTQLLSLTFDQNNKFHSGAIFFAFNDPIRLPLSKP